MQSTGVESEISENSADDEVDTERGRLLLYTLCAHGLCFNWLRCGEHCQLLITECEQQLDSIDTPLTFDAYDTAELLPLVRHMLKQTFIPQTKEVSFSHVPPAIITSSLTDTKFCLSNAL